MSHLKKTPSLSLDMNMCLSGPAEPSKTINSDNAAVSNIATSYSHIPNNKPIRGMRNDKDNVSIAGNCDKRIITASGVYSHKRRRQFSRDQINHEQTSLVVDTSRSSHNYQSDSKEVTAANNLFASCHNPSNERVVGEKAKLYSEECETESEAVIPLPDENNDYDPVMEKAARIIAEMETCLNDMHMITVKNAILMDSLVMVGIDL